MIAIQSRMVSTAFHRRLIGDSPMLFADVTSRPSDLIQVRFFYRCLLAGT
jgi:hypothetical protein